MMSGWNFQISILMIVFIGGNKKIIVNVMAKGMWIIMKGDKLTEY